MVIFNPRRTLVFIALVYLIFPNNLLAQEKDSFRIFSDEPRLLIVQGYSTSFHWPHLLKGKLDRHFNGQHQIEIKRATKGGTPIARWMDVKTGERKKPWIDIIQPALSSKGDRPAIVLAQQSLQWVFGERDAGIRNAENTERIAQGAKAIRTYVQHLFEDGADHIFIAMHIYKKPLEPGIGNERLALAQVLKENIPNLYEGPDVWVPTSKLFPKAFDTDGLHPGSIGTEIMAQLWFESLLKHDGLSVPEWSRQEMEKAIAGEPMSRFVMQYKGLLPGSLSNNRRWQNLVKQFDTDKDGKLSETEFANLRESEKQKILNHQ
ncbi:MAG: hypothetical protein QGG64_03405 [Candidatus Latescibacteria bacterium]|jgi:hypothetical protein|nr:hypothetical protein [Candidatus Latescibacterota bacterium]